MSGYSEHWEARGFSAAPRVSWVSRLNEPFPETLWAPSLWVWLLGDTALLSHSEESGMHSPQPAANC